MAITGGMVFSSPARVPGAALQGAEDVSSPAAVPVQGGAQGDSFDSLMNFLLAAPRPSAGTTIAGGETPAATAATVVPDAAAADPVDGLLAGLVPELATAQPGPAPAVESLPQDGKVLPPVDESAGVDVAVDGSAEITHDGGDDPLHYACGAETIPAKIPEVPEMKIAGPADDGGEASADGEDPAAFAALPAASVPIPDAPVPDGGEISMAAAPVQPQAQLVAQTQTLAPSSAPLPSATASGSASDSTAAVSSASAAVPVSAMPDTAAVRDATAPRSDTAVRAEQAPAVRADLPSSGTGTQHSDTTGEGGARLQELLARLGGDGATRTSAGENFRSLLQGAEAGTTAASTGALTYAQANAAAAPARDPAQPSLPVHTPLRHPEWSDEVSQRIRWAIGNQVQSAELKINPPQLGPVDVRISVDADRQMTVTLASQHALVRETLTDSLPRLRDLMSEHGFGAVNVDVSQHSFQDGRQSASHAESDPAARAAADTQAGPAANSGAAVRHETRGLVDLYA